jgi:predicted secreted Zn-dependent protease
MSERQARRAAEDRELFAATAQAIEDAIALMAREPIRGLRDLVAALCRRHRITMQWTEGSAVPGVARAHANWRTRRIVAPHIRTVQDAATALHEIGHVLQGACPNVGLHRRDSCETAWWHCLECERDASERALRLGAPFTKDMHQWLADALRSYLRNTPAPPDVKRRAERFTNGVSWRETIHAQTAHQLRLERHQEMTRFVREMKYGK